MKANFRSILGLLLTGVLLLGSSMESQAQVTSTDTLDGRINTVNTAVPFLRIAPDARSGAMGDMGVALSPDANAMFWNPSKLAFAEDEFGISITYTPWLRELVSDIYLADLSGYMKVDKNQAIGASLRYFSLGNIVFTDITGQTIGQFKPNEFIINGAYSRALADNFAVGLGIKYVYSNLASGQQSNGVTIKPGQAVAADISGFYHNDVEVGEYDSKLRLGFNFSNIGTKISYTESATNKDFIPTNMGLGANLEMNFDEHNSLSFGLDVNKLLVPTPDTVKNANGEFAYKDKSPISGIFSSFGDAPGGGSEELKEFMLSIGAEYWYDNQFAVRAGYFWEHETKGNRKFFTVGLGLKYNVFGLNFSYLIPTSSQRHPLNNTLRFSLLFDFEALATDAEDAIEE